MAGYTYSEAVSLTRELGKHVNENTPFSISEKRTIEKLYFEVLGRDFKPTSCQQCYHDALVEIYIYLKENKSMAEKSKYRLRAGFIIHSPNFHGGFVYNNDNLTDAVAKEYLQQYPKNAVYFSKLPEDEATEGGTKPVEASKAAKAGNTKAKAGKGNTTKKNKK